MAAAEENQTPKLAYEPPNDDRPATAAPTELELEQNVPTIPLLDRSPPHPAHDPYSALRLPVYRLFIGNYSLAVIGTQVMSVAVQWDLAQRTQRPIILGLLGGVQAIPVILLALFAGHVSDKFSRKLVMLMTHIVLVICPLGLAALAHFGSHSDHYVASVLAIMLVDAVALTFGRPARQSLLPQLVPKEIFPNAVTWNSSIFEVSTMTGPAIGGLIIARWSVPAALFLSSACTFVCIWLTCLLPTIPPANRSEPMSFDNLVAGVRFVFARKILLATMTLDLFAVLFGGATFVLPFFAFQKLHMGAVGYGCLRAAPSIGAVTMAMLIAHSPPMKRAGRAMLLAVAGFGAATIVFALSNSFWLSMAMLFLTGACDNVSVVVRHTLVQLLTPDSMRGRVSAVNQVFIGSSNELGGLESGLAAYALGLVPSVVLGGICTILVVSTIAVVAPQIRRFGSLHNAGPETE